MLHGDSLRKLSDDRMLDARTNRKGAASAMATVSLSTLGVLILAFVAATRATALLRLAGGST
ncbi:MAG: hypothetical protein B7Y50_09740 [Hydrogenophilales bacterium 28-61-11]|nr:MAG: hypothetical protein B7Y50_09740 [Hydrogenophilales bacterium 28-61-11]OYZ56798.1 MAG: hypothetical protein B7Y21_10180 [Hydrogenophilales bacterium 16-61-112]OZA43716.1 MAG: hypothetical protein B7X81_10850 [Hydrogenophilales bacterium 17-61-76]